jgi:hypothetical protein
MIEFVKTWSRDFASTVQIVVSVAQFFAALILFLITRRYVHYTSQLVGAQILPRVSLDIPDSMTAKLVVMNNGTQPVLNLRIGVQELRFFETKTGPVGMSRGAYPRFWCKPELAVAERAGCLIGELARTALTMGQNERQMWGKHVASASAGLMGVDDVTMRHVLCFTLLYEREVDRRQFEAQAQFLVLRTPPNDEPSFLPIEVLSRVPTFSEYCRGKGVPVDEKA